MALSGISRSNKHGVSPGRSDEQVGNKRSSSRKQKAWETSSNDDQDADDDEDTFNIIRSSKNKKAGNELLISLCHCYCSFLSKTILFNRMLIIAIPHHWLNLL
jgi:hypothetical protein